MVCVQTPESKHTSDLPEIRTLASLKAAKKSEDDEDDDDEVLPRQAVEASTQAPGGGGGVDREERVVLTSADGYINKAEELRIPWLHARVNEEIPSQLHSCCRTS